MQEQPDLSFMDRAVEQINQVHKWKQKMLRHGLRIATANCPVCGGGDTVTITINGPRNHIHCGCRVKTCGWGMME